VGGVRRSLGVSESLLRQSLLEIDTATFGRMVSRGLLHGKTFLSRPLTVRIYFEFSVTQFDNVLCSLLTSDGECSRKTGRLRTASLSCSKSRGLETKTPLGPNNTSRGVSLELVGEPLPANSLALGWLAAPSPPGAPSGKISATAAKRAHGSGVRGSRCGGGPNKTLAAGPTARTGKRPRGRTPSPTPFHSTIGRAGSVHGRIGLDSLARPGSPDC